MLDAQTRSVNFFSATFCSTDFLSSVTLSMFTHTWPTASHFHCCPMSLYDSHCLSSKATIFFVSNVHYIWVNIKRPIACEYILFISHRRIKSVLHVYLTVNVDEHLSGLNRRPSLSTPVAQTPLPTLPLHSSTITFSACRLFGAVCAPLHAQYDDRWRPSLVIKRK